MSIYVLVHGGFMGGWVWREVANYLRAAGHEVFTPTLTGFGERGHLLNRETGLYTHIQDVGGVLETEDLKQVILLGYSYGGMIITGVAERMPERISRLVYLDALIPKDKQSIFDLLGSEYAKQILELVNKQGDAWLIPANDPPRWRSMPIKTHTQLLEIKNPVAAKIPRAYIFCTIRPKDSPQALAWPYLDRVSEEVKKQGYWYREINADHFSMFSKPKEIADLLLELA